MPYRTRSARLAASLLSAVVAVLAFAVPSRAASAATGPAVQAWTAAAQSSGPHSTNSPGQQRPRAHGPYASSGQDTPRAVHATVAHLHQAHVPHPPHFGATGATGATADRAPLRALGGPDARPGTSTPSPRFADAAPEPRGPPSRQS